LVAGAGLELVILLPSFPNVGITGMYYHIKSSLILNKQVDNEMKSWSVFNNE
jgi:hypothetical protein